MTPKEKAKNIINKFCYAIRTEESKEGYYTNVIHAKACALLCVDEIIQGIHNLQYNRKTDYWDNVKKEIERL